MKKTIIFISAFLMAVLLNAHDAYAQFSDDRNTFIYAELGGGGAGKGNGDISMFNCGVNTIFAHNNIISLSFDHSWRTAPDQPADFFDKNGSNVRQTFSMCNLMYGKVINTNSQLVRFILKGGLSYGQVNTPGDFTLTKKESWNFLNLLDWLFGGTGSPTYYYTYDYKIKSQNVFGLAVNPQIEFPVARGFGFSLGLYANINSVATIYSINGNITFGRLRNRYLRGYY